MFFLTFSNAAPTFVLFSHQFTPEVQRALEHRRQMEERNREQELPQYTNPSGIVNIQNGQVSIMLMSYYLSVCFIRLCQLIEVQT